MWLVWLTLMQVAQDTPGARLYLEGRFAEARVELEAAAPTPEKHFWLGYTYLALNNKPAAIDQFEAYLKTYPKDEDVLYALARTYAQLAEMSLQQIFVLAPDSARAHQMRAIRYELEGEWRQAIRHYEIALKLDPNIQGVHSSIGRILEKELHDPAQARAAYARESKRKPASEPLETLLRRRAEQPDNPDVYFLLGEAYTDLKVKAIQRLRDANPRSYRLHQILAENYASIHRKAEAVVEYREVLRLQPKLPGVHYELARLLADSEPEQARLLLEQELEIDPQHYLARSLLGQLYAALREPAKAIPYLEQAIAAKDDLLDAHKALGRALLDTRNAERAVGHLERVASERPEDEQIHFLLAQAYRALGRSDDAAREMKLHQQTLRRLSER